VAVEEATRIVGLVFVVEQLGRKLAGKALVAM
jgi:hypothetical protein